MCARLLNDAAARCRVVVGADLVLIAVNVVDVSVTFPLVVDSGDGDQLHRLPLLQDPGGLWVFCLMLLNQTLRGLRYVRVWEADHWVQQVLAVLVQLFPAH